LFVFWIDTQAGHRCTRHDYEFRRGEVCQACVADPGDAPGDAADNSDYQLALATRINEYRSRARICWRRAEDLEGTEREENVAVKWSAEAVKWARLAEERQEVLDSREHDLELIGHEREMSGLRRRN
jgi:hypothetical protein